MSLYCVLQQGRIRKKRKVNNKPEAGKRNPSCKAHLAAYRVGKCYRRGDFKEVRHSSVATGHA